MSGLTLWDIGAEWQAIVTDLVEQGGELTPETAGRMAALGLQEANKVEAYYHVVQTFAHFEAAAKAEAAVMASKVRVAQNAQARLKQFLLDYMVAREVTELPGTTHKATIQNNGGPQPLEVLVQTEALPRELCTITVAPNLEALRGRAGVDGKVLAPDGEVLAELVPRGKHVRWR